MSARRTSAGWAGVLALVACRGEERPVFVTEHLVVEAHDSDVICQGTLDDMEAQVQRVADLLGVGLPSTLRVRFGTSAVEALCDEDQGGCARGLGADTRVSGDYFSIHHELVHGVRLVNGVKGTQFFEEGLAEVLGVVTPAAYDLSLSAADAELGPAALASRPRGEFTTSDYATAAHFLAWAIDTHGMETVVAFLVDEDYTTAKSVEVAFERHFGLSLAEADQAWRMTSDVEYVLGGVCDPTRELVWTGEALEWEQRLDCENHDTLGPVVTGHIATRTFCFSLATSGVVRVEFEAPAGEVFFRSDGCEEATGLTPEHYQTKTVGAGEALELPFAGCTWSVLVWRPEAEAMDFSLRLTRL